MLVEEKWGRTDKPSDKSKWAEGELWSNEAAPRQSRFVTVRMGRRRTGEEEDEGGSSFKLG